MVSYLGLRLQFRHSFTEKQQWHLSRTDALVLMREGEKLGGWGTENTRKRHVGK